MNGKSTSGKLKLLIDYGVLMNTTTRLNRCGALLLQAIECAMSEGIPESHISCLVGVSGLLETITSDFFEEIKACVGAEEARKRNRQRATGGSATMTEQISPPLRTSPERKQKHEQS